jgi:predicted dinucleotide-binding enzyme
MKIGILGTGMVATALGTRLAQVGHSVALGSRHADNPAATGWAAINGGVAGTFADAAAHGELLVNATFGAASVAALCLAGTANLDGKILVDVANPLDFSCGFPPSLSLVNTDSLGERIQATFPGARVVKTLNTVLAHIMVDPASLPGAHHVFVAGEDPAAKEVVKDLLTDLGWGPDQILDLGGIRASRGVEMYMTLWLALDSALGTGNFNISVIRI